MEGKPKISILHPSFKRPELAKKCHDIWMSNAENPDDIEYILCLSKKDPTLLKYLEIFAETKTIGVLIEDNGWVKQLNEAAIKSNGDLLICIGDDFSCPPHYDLDLIHYLSDKEDYIVKTQDGQQPWIMTLPIMDRKYYERFGYVIYPEYLHMFGDTELTHVADLLGHTINLPLVFPHNHYTTGINPKDEVNIENDKTWIQGETLYLDRFKNNFGLTNTKEINLPMHHRNWLMTKGIRS